MTAGGAFREDLYYRLNVVQIEMPPLSRRREDIPLLIAHFLAQVAAETGERRIYPPEALELLATAEWPGNVPPIAECRAPDGRSRADAHYSRRTGAAIPGRRAGQTAFV